MTQKLFSVKGSRLGRAGAETSVVHQSMFFFFSRRKLEDHHHSVERKKIKTFQNKKKILGQQACALSAAALIPERRVSSPESKHVDERVTVWLISVND